MVAGDSLSRVAGGEKTAYWTRDVWKSSMIFTGRLRLPLKRLGEFRSQP